MPKLKLGVLRPGEQRLNILPIKMPVQTQTPTAPIPTKPASITAPALSIVEYYQLCTSPGDLGMTRNIIETIRVPGNFKGTKFIKTRRVLAKSGSISSSALESQDTSVKDDLSTNMKSSAEQEQFHERSDWKFDASMHGEASWGPTEGEANADVHASGAFNGARDSFKSGVEAAVNTQVSSTEQFRKQTATEVANKTEQLEEGESIETFEIDNLANPESTQYVLCQLAVEKLTVLSLINVKLGLYDARSKQFAVFPLSGMDQLLEKAIKEPAHRDIIRNKIVAELMTYFDYEDKPHAVIEKSSVPSGGEQAGRTLIRFRTDLTTPVTILRPDGSNKKFTVKGIALDTAYRVLPVTQVGLARGVAP